MVGILEPQLPLSSHTPLLFIEGNHHPASVIVIFLRSLTSYVCIPKQEFCFICLGIAIMETWHMVCVSSLNIFSKYCLLGNSESGLMAAKPKLYYFRGRGRMESIRWLLAAAGVEVGS
jgi:hypothetical protein